MTNKRAIPYAERLRDPRWQKRRLQVMQRSNWACEHCGDKKSPLEVHHAFYKRGKNPWEYPLSTLACLCCKCHDEWHMSHDELLSEVAMLIQCVNGYSVRSKLTEKVFNAVVEIMSREFPEQYKAVLNKIDKDNEN